MEYARILGCVGILWICKDMVGYVGGVVCTWLEALVHASQRFFVCPPMVSTFDQKAF